MFQSIIGHKNITSFLEKSLKNDEVSHAYLFYGPAHLGKKTTAEIFAEKILGRSIVNHPDVYSVVRELNEKEERLNKNISVAQIRELERKLSLSSFLNSYKIGIIEEAEAMNDEAANSLLKTLEEPTPKTVIILLSTSAAALPATIVSRCQTIKFLPVANEKIYEHLIGLGASRDEAREIAGISWGKPGAALDFWRNRVAESGQGAVGEYTEKTKEIIDLMNFKTMADRMKIFERVFHEEKSGEDLVGSLNKVLSLWLSVLRDAVLVKNGCPELISHSNFSEEIKKIAGRYDGGFFPRIYRQIGLSARYLGENFNQRLVLENLLLSF
jgi:DNA polymerase-3 subunit delta'